MNPFNITRLLRASSRIEWITSQDILDLLGVERGAPRAKYHHAILRLVANGRWERDASSWPYLYRITDAGRAAMKGT